MKRIALGLFLAGTAVGVANAAEVRAVASKGYVDAVVGILSGLQTREKSSVVSAINELVGRLTQTINANSTTTQYPSAKAVYDAIQGVTYQGGTDINIDDDNKINATYESLDYMSTNDAVDHANMIANGYAVSYVFQENGKVKVGGKQYTQVVDATNAEGDTGKNAPSTAAVWNAIQTVSGEIQTYEGGTDINIDDENKVNATYESLDYDSYTDTAGNANKLPDGYSIVRVQQDNGELTISAKKYVEVFDETSANETQAPMTKTVYNALQGKQDAFADGTDATTNTGFISSVTQTNGTVDAVATAFDTEVTAEGTDNTAPTTAAVYAAIDAVSDQTSHLNLQQVGGDGKFVKLVSQADGQVSATAMEFDTVISDTTGGHTDTAPTTKAVYDAMSGKVNLNQEVGNAFMITDDNGKVIPAPVQDCSNRENKCVLTFGVIDDNGTLGYAWEVIARGN